MKPVKFHMLIVTTIVLLFLFGWVGYRIAPESSPVARGAVYAEFSSCGGCYSDPNNLHVNEIGQECITIDETAWYSDKGNECADTRAYFESVRLRRNFEDRVKNNIDNPLIAGEQLARKYYCFQCHGQLGQGGFKNAKSLTGYVPGYFGNDFKILTRNGDPDSVREWIMQGVDPKILENPVTGRIAEFFFKREAINMPSYKSLDSEEIEILVNYVIALNEFGPMTAEDVRLYGEL